MNKKSMFLLGKAHEKKEELSHHVVLSAYWPQLSLVLKGSTARGNADRYSDIDLVFYAADEVKQSIVAAYHDQGLTDRTDGIFIHFEIGHYHIETYDMLAGYFDHRDFIHCWEVEHTVVLSDPTGRFAQVLEAGRGRLFQDRLDIVRRAYLDLQLDLDWMRMPITRADGISTFLHAGKIVQGLCRVAYLLDGQSYPPDKWIERYLPSTRWGRANVKALRAYLENCQRVNDLVLHSPYAENPLYKEAAGLIGEVKRFIRKEYGELSWLEKWYNYV